MLKPSKETQTEARAMLVAIALICVFLVFPVVMGWITLSLVVTLLLWNAFCPTE